MAQSNQNNIGNALLMAGRMNTPRKNTPTQYYQLKRQYLGDETISFIEQYAKYSSDYVEAQVQGLFDDPWGWNTINLRMSDIIKPSATTTKNIDDYKVILIDDRRVDYIRPGTKFVTMGSTWIADNPLNIANTGASSIVYRCNAVYNYLDFYGNLQQEPLVVERSMASASAPDTKDTMLLTKGYFPVICQYNPVTAQFNTNTRMILGGGAYKITGYADFFQEFTGDYNSVRILEFYVRYEEPNNEIDDMENHVAEGKTFAWDIWVSGAPTVTVGETKTLSAESKRTSGGTTETVVSTTEHPVNYTWSSSNTDVATVDDTGNVTAVDEGNATITVTLSQNTEIQTSYNVTVAAADETPHVAFTGTTPTSISAYSSAGISAVYYENGEETENAITWSASGADKSAYSLEISGNTLTIHCWHGSVKPLVITASYGGYSTEAEIALEGV